MALLAGGDFKRQNNPSAAFLSVGAIGLIGKEEFAGVEEERSKFSAIPIGPVQIAALEYADEKVLGQVLRLFLRVAAAADVGVNGIPVLLAQAWPPWLPAATTRVQLVTGKSLRPASVCDVMALPFKLR